MPWHRMSAMLLALCLLALAASCAASPFQLVGNRVICGHARFSVLSPTLVRVETSAIGGFVDEPSVLVLNRDWPVCPFQACIEDEWLVLRTAAMELRWLVGELPFSDENLLISWRAGAKAGTWRPGRKDQGNLRGTRGALDGIGRGNLPPLDSGLLSREGWTVLDDSERPLWLGEEGWLKERPDPNARDWYFFAYGQDYAHMLKEYVMLCGRIPMLPRYAWGPWYSRYWAFTDEQEREIVRKFRELGIPLDVLVVDVDWHKYGWEGYDWNEKLFPDPEGFLKWCHEQNVHVTLNNHPGTPLPAEDTHLAAAAEMAGVTRENAKRPLPWNLADRRSNRAFVEAVHWPLEKIGIDFWWIDGAAPSHMRGLSSDMWCAKTYYDGTQRRSGQRSLIFSRYGGLGQHRYPVGFSGDVHSEWDVLNYEVRFTARAGNVAFPYWSHDIGGFLGNRLDPELYVRWCQFGALSPVLRLHSNHGVREPWEYGEEAQRIVKSYFQMRMALYPYLNACQREAYDTGMPLCRALYMHWPELQEAYQYDYEYMLGPDILVAPVATHTVDGLAAKEIWFPPGLWWDWWTGEAIQGPRTVIYQVPLDRCPMFARAGAVIPLQPVMDYSGQKAADPVTLAVWAGAAGEGTLYEDDGLSLGYQKDAFAVTSLAVTEEGRDLRLSIAPRKGAFEGAVTRRAWVVQAKGVERPAEVLINGSRAQQDSWAYDTAAHCASVTLPNTPVEQATEVVLCGAASPLLIAELTRLGPIRSCAARALKLAEARGLQGEAVMPLRTLAEAQDAQVAEGLLEQAWRTVAQSGLKPTDREEVLTALVGLTVTARMTSVEGSGQPEARILAGTRFPLPGATLRANVVSHPDWPIQGEPQVEVASFGTTGTGTVAFRIVPPKTLDSPPLGLVAMGADFSLSFAGAELSFAARTGVDCSFVQQWRIIGPFPSPNYSGYDTVFPPEEALDLSRSYPGAEGEAKWQKTDWTLPAAGDDAAVFINLEPRFKPKDNVVAYGVAHILSDADKEATLHIGSDDGCKVWLNGDLVLAHKEPRPPAPDQDRVDVVLRKGLNTVLYKVVNAGGQWGWYLQVTGRDGKPIAGLKTERVE